VEKWKWPVGDGGPAMRWQAEVLGQDGYGTWLYSPRGSRHTRRDGSVVVLPCDGVQLLPRTGWWAAWWWDDEHWVSLDISTPPQYDGATWRYADLEIDLVLLADGKVEVYDRDEFDAAVRTGAMPGDAAAEATAAAEAVRLAMSGRQEPFHETGWRWLASAQRLAAAD
jgi:hypothetical protein